jgi:hypothetical protein
VIHYSHEGARHIWKTEGHNNPLEKTLLGLESCLPFITWLDTDLVVATFQIYFWEDSRTT